MSNYKFKKIKILVNRQGSSIIVLVFSLLALVGLAALVLDLGLILNQRYEIQKAIESAALMSASEYEIYEVNAGGASTNLDMPADAKISNASTGNASIHYKMLKNTNQFINIKSGVNSEPTVTFNAQSGAVLVETNATVPTFFISVLGIKKVAIQAKAAAINAPAYLSKRFPRPDGSILNGINGPADAGLDYKDTDIRMPLGSDTSLSAYPSGTVYNQNNNFDNIYGKPDQKVLSLGPGGHITLKLPETIYDGKGIDFIIYERGLAEGYFVYAGVDNDPADPYIDAANPGSGISWLNISCTGIPLYSRIDQTIGTYETSIKIGGTSFNDYKFYGSGLFELGSMCTDSKGTVIYDGTGATSSPMIKNIKYLKIIDDNTEDGFFIQPKYGNNQPSAIPTIIPGEHSGFSPGVDVDAVAILHHSRLISVSDFSAGDTDGDGLMDITEQMHGYNKNNPDSDGDGISDLIEHRGYDPDDTNILINSGPSKVLFKETAEKDVSPLVIEINP